MAKEPGNLELERQLGEAVAAQAQAQAQAAARNVGEAPQPIATPLRDIVLKWLRPTAGVTVVVVAFGLWAVWKSWAGRGRAGTTPSGSTSGQNLLLLPNVSKSTSSYSPSFTCVSNITT